MRGISIIEAKHAFAAIHIRAPLPIEHSKSAAQCVRANVSFCAVSIGGTPMGLFGFYKVQEKKTPVKFFGVFFKLRINTIVEIAIAGWVSRGSYP